MFSRWSYILALLVSAPLMALEEADHRVETRIVRFDEVRSLGSDTSATVLIDPPVDLEGVSVVYVDTLHIGLVRTEGNGFASAAFGVALSEGAKVLLDTPMTTDHLRGADAGTVVRLPIFPEPSEASVDRVTLSVGTREAQSPMECWLRPFPEVGGLTLHFVRGNSPSEPEEGLNESRFVDIEPVSIGGAGSSDWQAHRFSEHGGANVEGRGLAFVVQRGASFSDGRPAATIESELMLGDNTFLRLDDVRSPSTGLAAAEILNVTSSRRFDETERERLESAEIVGWRFRLVTNDSGRMTVGAGLIDPPTLVFLRDFRDCGECACEPDCDGDGVGDACEIAAGTALDLNENGVPDSCESNCDLDCDGDGVPDGCASDCDSNGVADVCEASRFAFSHDFGDGAPEFDAYLGAPDGIGYGLGGETVTFALDGIEIVDGIDADLNLYETRSKLDVTDEHEGVEVLVSDNGEDFVPIRSVGDRVVPAPAVVPGHGQLTRSFDL